MATALPDLEFAAIAHVLRAEGYVIEVTPRGSVKRCSVRFGQERWTAEAASATAALREIVGQMCPSTATRSLLVEAIERQGAEAQRPPPGTAPAPAGRKGPTVTRVRR